MNTVQDQRALGGFGNSDLPTTRVHLLVKFVGVDTSSPPVIRIPVQRVRLLDLRRVNRARLNPLSRARNRPTMPFDLSPLSCCFPESDCLGW